MNRSMISPSLIGHPSSARTIASIRTAMRSVSTSTPSQSKITSEIGLLTADRSPIASARGDSRGMAQYVPPSLRWSQVTTRVGVNRSTTRLGACWSMPARARGESSAPL